MMLEWQRLFWIFLAGGAGAVSRYMLGALIKGWLPIGWPWHTFLVNALGCFLFGLVWALEQGRYLTEINRAIILVGFLGAFTTFSSYIYDSLEIAKSYSWHGMITNLIGQVILGTLCMLAGIQLARWLH